jgi:signal peptide peptidase SppA
MPQYRFEAPTDGRPLAIHPSAVGAFYDAPERTKMPAFEERNGVAIVRVSGPLSQHQGRWCDSYEAILGRTREAVAARPRAILLALDTPGGDAQGCIEAGRELRASAAAAGIPLVAWTDGMTCSAGYALAAGASKIYASPSAIVGSIGTIAGLVDLTAMLASLGVRAELVTSGARKADGHPAKAISPDAIAATQRLVDTFAGMFFGWVSEARPSLSLEAIRALEAGIFVGADALRVGLVDQIASLDQAIEATARPAPAVPATSHRSGGAGSRARGNHMSKRVGAEMAEVELQGLRDAMGMPDQPPQEVVDAAAARISEENEEPAESKPEGDKPAEARAAKAEAMLSMLTERCTAMEAQLAELGPLKAEKSKRDREDAIDAAMSKRGMTATADRARVLAFAEKYGTGAALEMVAEMHVPPRSVGLGAPPAAALSGGHAPEGSGSGSGSGSAGSAAEAVALAGAAIRAEQPSLKGPAFYRAVYERARIDHPGAFRRES